MHSSACVKNTRSTALQHAPGSPPSAAARTVERFSKLKPFRAVATRCPERGCMYQAAVGVDSIRIWLRDPLR
jgi:hypothetical protein